MAKRSKKTAKIFLINDEDPTKGYFERAVNGSGKIVYFSRESFIKNELNGGKESIGDWLSNDFNLENAAATAAFGKDCGIDWLIIKKALESFKGVAGRMEVTQEKPFKVIIDYAHTPDSLEKVYLTLTKNLKTKNSKLICVLGSAGGGRDKWKRPVMGRIAAGYCNKIILTNEDPYNENPAQIISEIRSEIPGSQTTNIFEILDREEAIKKAILSAKKGDTVIITGKGNEPWMHLAHGKKIPWSEGEIVKEVLAASNREQC